VAPSTSGRPYPSNRVQRGPAGPQKCLLVRFALSGVSLQGVSLWVTLMSPGES
jgi:hypothetical protein